MLVSTLWAGAWRDAGGWYRCIGGGWVGEGHRNSGAVMHISARRISRPRSRIPCGDAVGKQHSPTHIYITYIQICIASCGCIYIHTYRHTDTKFFEPVFRNQLAFAFRDCLTAFSYQNLCLQTGWYLGKILLKW